MASSNHSEFIENDRPAPVGPEPIESLADATLSRPSRESEILAAVKLFTAAPDPEALEFLRGLEASGGADASNAAIQELGAEKLRELLEGASDFPIRDASGLEAGLLLLQRSLNLPQAVCAEAMGDWCATRLAALDRPPENDYCWMSDIIAGLGDAVTLAQAWSEAGLLEASASNELTQQTMLRMFRLGVFEEADAFRQKFYPQGCGAEIPLREALREGMCHLHEQQVKFNGKHFLSGMASNEKLALAGKLAGEFGLEVQIDLEYLIRTCNCYSTDIDEKRATFDYAAITEELLANRNYDRYLASYGLPLSAERLQEHFSDPANQVEAEYSRIYTIFEPDAFFRKIAEADLACEQPKERLRLAEILSAIASRSKMEEVSAWAVDKLFELVADPHAEVRESVAAKLGRVSQESELAFRRLSDIVLDQLPAGDARPASADPELGKQTALQALCLNPKYGASAVLFDYISRGGLDAKAREALLSNLVDDSRMQDGCVFGWRGGSALRYQLIHRMEVPEADLRYLAQAQKLPNRRLRKEAVEAFGDTYFRAVRGGTTVQELHRTLGSAVPPSVMPMLFELVDGSPDNMRAIAKHFRRLETQAERNGFLQSVASVMDGPAGFYRSAIGFLLRHIESLPRAADAASYLNRVAFISSDYSEGQKLQELYEQGELDFEACNGTLGSWVNRNLQAVLGSAAPDVSKLEELWEAWGTIDPIVTYAKTLKEGWDLASTLEYFGKQVSAWDPAQGYRGWKAVRYDLANPFVQEQVGHLSEEQLRHWAADHFVDLGRQTVETQQVDKSKVIRETIRAGLQHGHLEAGKPGDALILAELERVSGDLGANQEQGALRLRAEEQRVGEAVQALAREFEAAKLEKVWALYERAQRSGFVSLTGKDRNMTGDLLKALPDGESEILADAIRKAREADLKQLPAGEVFTAERKQILFGREPVRPALDASRKALLDFGIKEPGHQGTVSKALGSLAVLRDIYALCNLPEAALTIRPEQGAGNQALTLLDRLASYYRNTNFARDLETLRIVIAGRANPLRGRHIGLLITDNPQAMLQMGEYPAGSGSCQAVSASSSTAKALTGTVGAAHMKAGFAIDMDRLSPELRSKLLDPGLKLEELEFDWNELLDASLARELVKIGTISSQACVAGVNTYTPLKTGDDSWERLYDRGIDKALAEPMGVSLCRIDQLGQRQLALGGIESPSGSYEDGSLAGPSAEGGHFVTKAYEVRASVVRDRFEALENQGTVPISSPLRADSAS